MNNTTDEVKEFNNGAVRGSDPPEYFRITQEFTQRVAYALTKGAAEKYPDHEDGLDNWKHGDRDFARAAYDHLMEHMIKWKEGGDYPLMQDDHLAHAACNIMFLMWFETGGVWDPWGDELVRDKAEQEELKPVEEFTPPQEEEVVPKMSMEDRLRLFLGLPAHKGEGE